MSAFIPIDSRLNLPVGCPVVPEDVNLDTFTGIIDVEVYEAIKENELSPFTRQELDLNETSGLSHGARVFLHRLANGIKYSFGPRLRKKEQYDVYVPLGTSTKKLFELSLDSRARLWRIDATADTIVSVNGERLQKPQTKKRKSKKSVYLPYMVYLDVSQPVTVQFADHRGLKTVKLWLVQPDDLLGPNHQLRNTSNVKVAQSIPNHKGNRGVSLYIWDRRQAPVSDHSYRVTHRFTGEVVTAKVFQHDEGLEDRDREMLMFGQLETHSSIVRYQIATELNGVPAIITDTHESMIPFAAIVPDLLNMHPGARFKLAVGMLRPLFSAVAYLHCNKIFHGSISPASVLVQIVDDAIVKLLLVNYSWAYMVDIGEDMPKELMRHESAQVMDLVETCTNLWNLRQKPLPGFNPQAMRQATEAAEAEFKVVKQNNADMVHRRPDLWKKAQVQMLELQAHKERKWAQARTAQIQNHGMQHIGPLTKEDVEIHVNAWKQTEASQNTEVNQPMILSLGHAWLDDLMNVLYSTGIYGCLPLPSEICSKLRSLEGQDSEPWQSFRIQQSHEFVVHTVGTRQRILQMESRCFADYMAVCCELHPGLQKTIVEEYNRIIVPCGGMLLPEIIENFHESLKKRLSGKLSIDEPIKGPLPPDMNDALEVLGKIDYPGQHSIQQGYDINYHRPSQMFNITQVHRFASLSRLTSGLNNDQIRCENFVEVRGEPELEGNYVPLPMLHMFATAFDIAVCQEPSCRRSSITQDPSDFSQLSSRIVLAHRGLVGFASMTYEHDQVSHCPREDFEMAKYPRSGTFVATYFGDWKVLPATPNGIPEYTRPTHWAKYKTAEETEAASKGKRKKLTPMSISSKSSGASQPRPILGDRDPEAHCHLTHALRDRNLAIANASTPYKRPIDRSDPESLAAKLQRRERYVRDGTTPTMSQWHQEINLERVPPGHLDDPDQPFDKVPHIGRVMFEAKRMRDEHFRPEEPGLLSVDSDIREELAAGAQARYLAAPTVADDGSVDNKVPPTGFPPPEPSIASSITLNLQLARFGDLVPAVRAEDNRSFNNFAPNPGPGFDAPPVAPFPRTRVGHVTDNQSFYAGQTTQRPRGVTFLEHARSNMTFAEQTDHIQPRLRKPKAASPLRLSGTSDTDGDEDMPDTWVPDMDSGSRDTVMTGVENWLAAGLGAIEEAGEDS
ncbi:hypothetical protein BU23DRAFT_599768 [Bimuria novae-zelandiae CBS 107.79]|uniref:Protein kinase domain-containing protein n=1 Tax=Bimuria novae-zelandiae CBS 107.79 TaxID=1447943 RepID=A0A6A5VB86_9PLEO|nr:hypothetical protein BU23DRAFT_599768 [Bimuria novae-zelandiae CBS 107.79]